MITLIGAFLGFITSLAPEVFKLINQRQDNRQELAILDKQLEMQRLLGTQRSEEIITVTDAQANIAVQQYNPPVVGIKWVDGLSASVRPVITYCFFLAYCLVKVAQYNMLTSADVLPWLEAEQRVQQWFTIINQLWTEEDGALFAAIITFWFGNRMMRKREA